MQVNLLNKNEYYQSMGCSKSVFSKEKSIGEKK